LRQFDQHHAIAKERISALKQGAISAQYRSRFETEISDAVTVMEKLAGRSALEVEARAKLRPAIGRIRRSLESVRYSNNRAPALARLTPSRRRSFEAVICLIYECSSNASSAKRLVDKILAQLDKEL
jgi:uncharacterized sporulation protein YeaH/YhbH (DUF444 family)